MLSWRGMLEPSSTPLLISSSVTRPQRNIMVINGGIATIYGVLWWALPMVRQSWTTVRSGCSMSTSTFSRRMVHSESLYVECHEIWTKIFHRLDNHPVCVKVRWRSNGWMYMVVYYWLTTLRILNHQHIRLIVWFQCYQTLIYAEKLSPKVTYLLRTVHCGHVATFTQPCHLLWCGMIRWRWQIYIWLIERKYQLHDES